MADSRKVMTGHVQARGVGVPWESVPVSRDPRYVRVGPGRYRLRRKVKAGDEVSSKRNEKWLVSGRLLTQGRIKSSLADHGKVMQGMRQEAPIDGNSYQCGREVGTRFSVNEADMDPQWDSDEGDE